MVKKDDEYNIAYSNAAIQQVAHAAGLFQALGIVGSTQGCKVGVKAGRLLAHH